MSTDSEQLVRDVMAITHAPPPGILDKDSPALAEQPADDLYLIGLIGGKEVGKSALVNALAGDSITEETSHGPGTQIAVAYVHRARQEEISELLGRIIPGKFQVHPHDNDRLRSQVLLDLPDIDSRFTPHLEVTRKTLRHTLFPIWIQSVEKYADAQPQQLLAKVAAGNDPGNFLFALNKADQIPAGDSREQLRDDYGRRVARVLQLPSQPRVFLISAIHPTDFDLPELIKLLSREKTEKDVKASWALAQKRRNRSLLAWLDAQDLPGRAQRLKRLEDEAGELLSQRVGVPLLETAVPAILDDAAYRAILTDGVFARRVGRWPIVNVLSVTLAPLRILLRENAASFFGGGQRLVDDHFNLLPQKIAQGIQSAFAQVHQSSPGFAELYDGNRLWDAMPADQADGRLRAAIAQTIEHQRRIAMDKLSGRVGVIAPFIRILLTIGALLWFPIVQPILHLILNSSSPWRTAADVARLVVEVISSQSLLQNAVLLLLWYLLIWSLLRWDTRRRVDRLLAKWKSSDTADPDLSPAAACVAWLDDLLAPVALARARVTDLAARIEQLRDRVDK